MRWAIKGLESYFVFGRALLDLLLLWKIGALLPQQGPVVSFRYLCSGQPNPSFLNGERVEHVSFYLRPSAAVL